MLTKLQSQVYIFSRCKITAFFPYKQSFFIKKCGKIDFFSFCGTIIDYFVVSLSSKKKFFII